MKRQPFVPNAMYKGIPVRVVEPIGKEGLMYCQAEDKIFYDGSEHFKSNRHHRDLHVWGWELIYFDDDEECCCEPDGRTCPACVLHQELVHGEEIPF